MVRDRHHRTALDAVAALLYRARYGSCLWLDTVAIQRSSNRNSLVAVERDSCLGAASVDDASDRAVYRPGTLQATTTTTTRGAPWRERNVATLGTLSVQTILRRSGANRGRLKSADKTPTVMRVPRGTFRIRNDRAASSALAVVEKRPGAPVETSAPGTRSRGSRGVLDYPRPRRDAVDAASVDARPLLWRA